jgi:hypothetical protein
MSGLEDGKCNGRESFAFVRLVRIISQSDTSRIELNHIKE